MGDHIEIPGSPNPITVALVQINNSFSGQNYLPYSVGLLESYVRNHAIDPRRYEFKLPIYKRTGVAVAVDRLLGTDIVGFSTYVWNSRLSLEIARRLKQLAPSTLVVFGGPQVPDDPEDFLRRHRFIDLVVHNEGEVSFLKILEAFPSCDWSAIPGISSIQADGGFIRTPNAPRLRDLDQLPSPFLDGTFDRLIASVPDEQWIGLWETNRGCPFQCTFCDWGSATAAKVSKFGLDRLQAEVNWFARHHVEYIFCCDANFGIQKRDVDIAAYVASVKRSSGYPKALSVQNTKNATERAYETQKILSDAGLNKGVALSMQTLDPTTLVNIKRDNISLDTYLELQRRFTRDGVETYSDLILGLPGETFDSFADGVDLLIENGQHNRIQFNNLSILPNAEMGSADYQARFGMVTIVSAIINIHGQRLISEDDVVETQDLVIATAAMPEADWCRTRAFSWMAAFLYFDKLFQLPIILLHHLADIRYRTIIEAVLDAPASRYPLLAELRAFFLEEARSIQAGGAEYVYSKDWLGIYWPADEFMFIKLTAEHKLDAIYAEMEALLKDLAAGAPGCPTALRDAVRLNRALLKQPFVKGDLVLELDHDILTFYRSVLEDVPSSLKAEKSVVRIDRTNSGWNSFDEWCREVVWWGNKKGAYLYGSRVVEPEIAGHY